MCLGAVFNGLKIKGVEYDDEKLNEAGISTADAILSVTPDENVNITVSLIAKKIYQVPRIIARIVNPNREYIYEKLGIETVNPTQLGADILKAKLSVDHSGSIAVINKDYGVAKISIAKDRRFTVKELEEKFSCVISAIIREESLFFPSKEDLLLPGEKIICTICKSDLERLINAV